MKKIILLGASGSIGNQTIDVICDHPEAFELVGLSVGHNLEYLHEVLKKVNTKHICVIDPLACQALQQLYPDRFFYYGDEGLIRLAQMSCDVVVNALVGFAGLKPTIAAIKSGHTIALANKETLVVAGDLIKSLAKQYKVSLVPIDSEHSAIFQVLQGEKRDCLKRLIITASGGSFRHLTREELKNVSVADALKHPNWQMGSKITIDSATMFNKGFEVIEAHHLFDVDYDDIDVVIHEQSVVHSMVEFVDTSIIAQLGTPNMRVAISYALSYPNRLSIKSSESLDFTKALNMTFKPVDFDRYPALKMAYEAGRAKGSAPVVLNGANEQAVALFLEGKIPFLAIEELVAKALNQRPMLGCNTLEEIIECDHFARQCVMQEGGFL